MITAPLPLAGAFLALDNPETWVLVAFILFVGVLTYAGVPNIVGKALDDRADKIRTQLEEARQLREEAQSALAEFQRRQQEVQDQAREIVERAKAETEMASKQAQADIEASVAQRLRTAEAQIAMAEADAIRKVRNEAVDAAVAASQKLLKSSVSGKQSGALIDDAISEVSKRLN